MGSGFIMHKTTDSLLPFLQFLNALDDFLNVLVRRESFKKNILSSKFATWLSYFNKTFPSHVLVLFCFFLFFFFYVAVSFWYCFWLFYFLVSS